MSYWLQRLWTAVARSWQGLVGFIERHGWLVALALLVVAALAFAIRRGA